MKGVDRMEQNKKELFSISQFSALTGITRPNLIFYDKENLLKPVLVRENGYRMYNYKQISLAYKIITYRKMGISLEQIRRFLSDDSSEELSFVMDEQIHVLEEQIQEMQQQKYNLLLYKESLAKYKDRKSGSAFEIEELSSEPLWVSPSLESQFGKPTTMNQYLMHCREKGIVVDCHIGRMFTKSLDSNRDWQMADCVFFKKLRENERRPAGTYLIYTDFTDGSTINHIYEAFFSYIKEKKIEIIGNIYEDYPLSGIFASDRAVHFLRIFVQIKR